MLELVLTTECCQEILDYVLQKNSWSLARAARSIGVPTSYLNRVQAGEQSFQVANVEALAKACGLQSHELLFYSIKRDKIPAKVRGLYDLAQQEVERHREFSKIMMKKPTRKLRQRTTAAAAKTSPKPAAKRAFART
jgi:hypothetical protein